MLGFCALVAQAQSITTIGFVRAEHVVDELGSVVLEVERLGDGQGAVSVGWTATNDTAYAGANYGVPGDPVPPWGFLNWADGDLSPKYIRVGPANSEIPLIDNESWQPLTRFHVALTPPGGGAQLGAINDTLVSITDSEDGIRMAALELTVAENAGSAQVEVRRRGNSSGSAAVGFSTSNGTALAGTHYDAVSGILAWGPFDSTKRVITVPVVNNTTADGTRTFRVHLSNATGVPLLAPSTTLVSIAEDDNTVQFAGSTATVSESATSVMVTVTRSGVASGPVSVQWVSSGSAIAGTDFGGPTSGTLTWGANELTSRTIVIPLLNDAVAEDGKVLQVALVNPVNARTTSPAVFTVFLNDDDPGVGFSASTYTVTEAGGAVTLQVLRMGPVTNPASVRWSAAAGTATPGLDFGTRASSVPPSGVLAWRAGESAAKTIVIPILRDALSEGTESFTVSLTSPSAGLILVRPSTATVTLTDDEVEPQSRISFVPPKLVVREDAGTAVLTLRRESIGAGFTVPATVTYAVYAGTALPGSDFVTKSGSVSWSAADSSDKSISVVVVNDAVAEPPEAFKVRLSAPSSGTQIGTPEAIVTILDDDEVFPPMGAVPGDWVIPAAANAGWHATSEPGAFEGAYSLRSDAISDGETAQVEVTRSFAAGNVTFRVRVSSEPSFDKLRFFIDGDEKGSWSGTAVPGWTLFTTPITAGSHTLRWSYEKDGGVSIGSDAAWIDAVAMP